MEGGEIPRRPPNSDQAIRKGALERAIGSAASHCLLLASPGPPEPIDTLPPYKWARCPIGANFDMTARSEE
jgi:hypothetical protein